MHILFLSDNFPPETNAPASRLYEHATRWVEAGHTVTVITCAPNFPMGKVFPGYRNSLRTVEHVKGIRVVRVKTYITANAGFIARTLDYLSFMVSSVIAGLFERAPTVIVASSPQFFCAVGGCLLALLRRRPFTMEVRDLWPDSIVAVGAMKDSFMIKALHWLELFLYRRAAAIVVVTASFKNNLIARGVSPAKVHVVYNGADLSWCRPVPRDMAFVTEFGLEDRFVVGYFGTLGLAHALDKVLDAAELLKQRDDIGFLFVGAGAEAEQLRQSALKRGLSNVHFSAPKPKSEMSRLWSVCDLGLIPLRDHPVFATVIPSKLFEAMAHSVPVLMAIPKGEATSIVETTECGVTVPPENVALLTEAIRSLADERSRMEGFRRSAAAATPRFSREVQARAMLNVLQGVASDAR